MWRRVGATTPAAPRLTCGHITGNPATHHDLEILGTFYFDWGEPPRLWKIETEEGLTLEDLMGARGRLELNALGYVKHGDVPATEG
jgi:hypothetical protein